MTQNNYLYSDNNDNSFGTPNSPGGTITITSTNTSGSSYHNHPVSTSTDTTSIFSRDYERENWVKAQQQQEHFITQVKDTNQASVLASDADVMKLVARGKLAKHPKIAEKCAKINAAVEEIKLLRFFERERNKTETTRLQPRKEANSNGMMMDDTSSGSYYADLGMKCEVDLQREKEAKSKAFQMISNGRYQLDPHQGILQSSKKGGANSQGIV